VEVFRDHDACRHFEGGQHPMPNHQPSDLFSTLLESFADRIAERVVARVEQLLEERTSPPDAYRLSEASRTLGLSEREIRRRIAAGELASRKVGKVVLIPREAISVFLSRNGNE
jgi:excisionase family DNA binding protein